MKICRFLHKNKISIGAIENDTIVSFNSPVLFNLPDVSEFGTFEKLNKSDVIFLPPCAPSKIVCVGRNYAEHAAELGNPVPTEPLLFLKAPSALVTDGENIVIPAQSKQVEYEGELAVVIGRTCKNIGNENPFNFILGYACLNDVTARDLQRRDVQFTRAKSFDSFCPLSKVIETNLDVSDLQVTTRVNGKIKQSARTAQMVFSIPFLVEYISQQMTLQPGDIIATGTPSGVSKLNFGDICEVEIEGIGTLVNYVK